MIKVYLSDTEIAELNNILENNKVKPEFLDEKGMDEFRSKIKQLSLM